MQFIRNLKKSKAKHAVVALGTFDGVHLGHKKLLKETVKYARAKKCKSAAITFDPHPQELICPERGLRLLTTLSEREELIAKARIDALAIIRFSRKLQKLSYEEFIKNYILKGLAARAVFVGYDFAFGKGRKGGAKELKRLGKKYNFRVKVIRKVKQNGMVVKSQIIRKLLSRGDFNKAVKLLDHPYIITGKVVRGAGRGRELGFPTANIKLAKDKLLPAHGVYIGDIFVDSKKYRSVINIGDRPTFPEDKKALEVHILHFKKNILGKKVTVYLHKNIRPEIQFSDVEELKKQIRQDIKRAKR